MLKQIIKKRALKEKRSLFKPMNFDKNAKHIDDVFCLRAKRTVDAYRKISLEGTSINVPKGIPRQTVNLCIVPMLEKNIAQIRFWQGDNYLGTQSISLQNLKTIVHF